MKGTQKGVTQKAKESSQLTEERVRDIVREEITKWAKTIIIPISKTLQY